MTNTDSQNSLTVGATKLIRWRKEKGLSRAQFAAAISEDPDKPMTQHAVGKYERGESRPSLPIIQRIKTATDGYVSADDWLDGEA